MKDKREKSYIVNNISKDRVINLAKEFSFTVYFTSNNEDDFIMVNLYKKRFFLTNNKLLKKMRENQNMVINGEDEFKRKLIRIQIGFKI